MARDFLDTSDADMDLDKIRNRFIRMEILKSRTVRQTLIQTDIMGDILRVEKWRVKI